MSYQYPLPAGVPNTNVAYFYAQNGQFDLGVFIKPVNASSLITISYANIAPPWSPASFNFLVNVGGNPPLVVSNALIQGQVLTFLVSGGIASQQYTLTINTIVGSQERSDNLTINIPSDGACVACTPGNVTTPPSSQGVSGQSLYYNDVPRFFISSFPPTNPNVMDWWYDTVNGAVSEFISDGPDQYWHVFTVPAIQSDAPLGITIYSRQNGNWVPDPIQFDAPPDGKSYTRINSGWAPTPSATTLWGTFNASTGAITWNVQSGQSSSSLPPPTPVNAACYLICSVAGSTPPVGAPAGSYAASDWVLSDGTRWIHISSGGAMYAAQVVVSPPVENATDVQTALANLSTVVNEFGVAISDTPPASPSSGTMWWDSVGGQLYVYYTDVNSSQWVIANNSLNSTNLDMGTF